MPGIGPERRAAGRRRFVTAARELAAERGYRDLTVDDVCAHAALSKGGFHGCLEAKQDLLAAAILNEEVAEVDGRLSALEGIDDLRLEEVRTFLRSMVLRGMNPADVRLRAALWSQVSRDPVLRERMAEVGARRVRVAAFATVGGKAGEMVEVPANTGRNVPATPGRGDGGRVCPLRAGERGGRPRATAWRVWAGPDQVDNVGVRAALADIGPGGPGGQDRPLRRGSGRRYRPGSTARSPRRWAGRASRLPAAHAVGLLNPAAV